MSNWGYIILGWSITGGAVGLYASRLIVRGRKLSQKVPAERSRWMQ